MKIDNYKEFTSQGEIEYIKKLGGLLGGRCANVVTTAAEGGGVAELLGKVMPFLEDYDFVIKRRNITIDKKYLNICKRLYEGLSNTSVDITKNDIEDFKSYFPQVKEQIDSYCDLLFVHDHSPIAAVENKNFKKAVWRCHIDISHPDPMLWNFLKPYIEKYDAAAFSFPSFSRQLSIPKFSIMPSIDPLSDKNKDIPPAYINSVFEKYNIPRNKPVLMQIGRFDMIKDPFGVLEVFKEVKKEFDCTLVLAGGHASDDPHGHAVYQKVFEGALSMPDVHVVLMEHNDTEINALQRGADIIIQKSLRESFGLAITEALWKKKPVVATETGGVPLQITEGKTGLFSVSNATCAAQVKRLLKDPELARKLGQGGHEHVRENFLVTRHIRDLMIMFGTVLGLEV